jgi:hypothetical protein
MSKNKSAPQGGRKYLPVWQAISAAKVGEVVSIRVHHTAAATLIQAVSKEKSRETAEKKRLSMPFAGPLKIQKRKVDHAGYQIVEFSLQWDGRKL